MLPMAAGLEDRKDNSLSHELSFPIKIVKGDHKIKIVENIPTVLAFGPIKRNKVEHLVADLKLL